MKIARVKFCSHQQKGTFSAISERNVLLSLSIISSNPYPAPPSVFGSPNTATISLLNPAENKSSPLSKFSAKPIISTHLISSHLICCLGNVVRSLQNCPARMWSQLAIDRSVHLKQTWNTASSALNAARGCVSSNRGKKERKKKI